MIKIYMDTEFNEDSCGNVTLISLALVTPSGGQLYAISSQFNTERANPWVLQNVIPKLESQADNAHLYMRESEISDRVLGFVSALGKDVQFWGWKCAYDWFLIGRLIGGLSNKKESFPHFCFDLHQQCYSEGFNPKSLDPEKKHNALNDAIWAMDLGETINALKWTFPSKGGVK